MAHPPAPALALREGDADVLRRGYGRRRCRGPAQRARIVLLAAEALPNSEIADRVGFTR